jgi:hypothetical protein
LVPDGGGVGPVDEFKIKSWNTNTSVRRFVPSTGSAKAAAAEN